MSLKPDIGEVLCMVVGYNEVAGGGRPGADWGDGTSSAVQPPNPDTADTPPPPPPPPTHVTPPSQHGE